MLMTSSSIQEKCTLEKYEKITSLESLKDIGERMVYMILNSSKYIFQSPLGSRKIK